MVLRISVITPCLNGVRHIGGAIDSVSRQGRADTEHIVADGGSTDGTLEALSRYSHLEILSGPDRGMYDAINRALAVARGELIGILNCDDCYDEDAFADVSDAFRDEGVMALAGEALTFRDDQNGGQTAVARLAPAGADVLYRATLGDPSINAWFFRASVFEKIGRFDPAYRVAGDREFMLRFALSGLRYAQVRRLICRYRIHADSMTFGGRREVWRTIQREHDYMTRQYLGQPALPRRVRVLLKRARTRDTIGAAIRSAGKGDLRSLLAHAIAGTRHDPVWPARFVKNAMRALALRIRA